MNFFKILAYLSIVVGFLDLLSQPLRALAGLSTNDSGLMLIMLGVFVLVLDKTGILDS